MSAAMADGEGVQRLGALDAAAVARLLRSYGLDLTLVADGEPIPGSYWGDSEAGLRESRLYARADTPLHSILHESAHYICMDANRRAGVDRDAGGDDAEECAVCYLQLLLAAALPEAGLDRALRDMDAWGYSFRLGSARDWFEQDAADARRWLEAEGVVGADGCLTGARRC